MEAPSTATSVNDENIQIPAEKSKPATRCRRGTASSLAHSRRCAKSLSLRRLLPVNSKERTREKLVSRSLPASPTRKFLIIWAGALRSGASDADGCFPNDNEVNDVKGGKSCRL